MTLVEQIYILHLFEFESKSVNYISKHAEFVFCFLEFGIQTIVPQHFLNFFPLSQGQGSFLPISASTS